MDSESCSSILCKMESFFFFNLCISASMMFSVKHPHLPSSLKDHFNTEEVVWREDLNTNNTRKLCWHLCIQVIYACLCLKLWEGKQKGSIYFKQKSLIFLENILIKILSNSQFSVKTVWIKCLWLAQVLMKVQFSNLCSARQSKFWVLASVCNAEGTWFHFLNS